MAGLFYWLVLFLQFIGVVVAKDVRWDSGTWLEVAEGSSLTVTCTVTGISPTDKIKLVKINSEIGSEATIAEDGLLLSPFLETERYQIDYENSSSSRQVNSASIRITYTDIRGEDSGDIRCIKESNKPISATETFHLLVKTSITDLYLLQKNRKVRDGEVIVYAEDEKPPPVICVAMLTGSLHPPAVWMGLGDTEISSTWSRSSRQVNNATLGPWQASTTVAYSPLRSPPYMYNGQSLECHAGHRRVSAPVVIKFAPRLECTDEYYYAVLGGSFKAHCSAQANPGNLRLEVVTPDNTTSDGVQLLAQAAVGDCTSIMLHIRAVQAAQFGEYTLKAINSLGQGEYHFSLAREYLAAAEVMSRASTSCSMLYRIALLGMLFGERLLHR